MTFKEAQRKERAAIAETAQTLETQLIGLSGDRFSWPYAFAADYQGIIAKLTGFGFSQAQADRIFWRALKSFAKRMANRTQRKTKAAKQ